METRDKLINLYHSTTDSVRSAFHMDLGVGSNTTIEEMIDGAVEKHPTMNPKYVRVDMYHHLIRLDEDDKCRCTNPETYELSEGVACAPIQRPGSCLVCRKSVRGREVEFVTTIKTKGPNVNGHCYTEEGLKKIVDMANSTPVVYVVCGQCKPINDSIAIMSVERDREIGYANEFRLENGNVLAKINLTASSPLMSEHVRDNMVNDVKEGKSCFGPRLITTSAPRNHVRDVLNIIAVDFVHGITHDHQVFKDFVSLPPIR